VVPILSRLQFNWRLLRAVKVVEVTPFADIFVFII
jgi:hypothetical protein